MNHSLILSKIAFPSATETPQFYTREFDICNANFNEYEILIFDSFIFRDGVDVDVFVILSSHCFSVSLSLVTRKCALASTDALMRVTFLHNTKKTNFFSSILFV